MLQTMKRDVIEIRNRTNESLSKNIELFKKVFFLKTQSAYGLSPEDVLIEVV